jgi:SAM-dependent methyltransferase
MEGDNLKFLDVGARDGELTYLLGIRRNLDIDQDFYAENRTKFDRKYTYFGLDILPSSKHKVLMGDVCQNDLLDGYPEFKEFFDVVYSNNVFEHFRKPWTAAKNLSALVKVGGLVVTIVPFASRYHESPGDYFRYSHTGVAALFEDYADYEVLLSGYDICGRRTNWQGGGIANDVVPVDSFGAWRENWFTVVVLRKRA